MTNNFFINFENKFFCFVISIVIVKLIKCKKNTEDGKNLMYFLFKQKTGHTKLRRYKWSKLSCNNLFYQIYDLLEV